MKALWSAVLLTLVAARLAAVEAPPRPASIPAEAKPGTFLIVLRLVPRLYDESVWTDAERGAVGRHFQRLKEATAAGQVVLAGRTEEPLDQTFGLVVFTAADEAAARAFMNGDPCVAEGVMTAELHPYSVALLKKS